MEQTFTSYDENIVIKILKLITNYIVTCKNSYEQLSIMQTYFKLLEAITEKKTIFGINVSYEKIYSLIRAEVTISSA